MENTQDKCWFRTFSGKVIDPENLKPEDIESIDIARSLSLQCRYAGQITRFYSVAEHSLHVSKMVGWKLDDYARVLNKDKVVLAALLHDASEAYLCDIPTPFKRLLPQYKALENSVMKVIHKRFNIELNEEESNLIDLMDKTILEAEIPTLFNLEGANHSYFNYYTPDQAFSMFLSRLIHLEKSS